LQQPAQSASGCGGRALRLRSKGGIAELRFLIEFG
jgi:hypothetical protein